MKHVAVVPIIGVGIGTSLLLAVSAWLYFSPQIRSTTSAHPIVTPPAVSPTISVPKNTPVQGESSALPLPQGKVPFSVSSGQKTGPQFRNGFIDPYDPKTGETQTVSVLITGKSPVITVTATMRTDTASKTNTMKLLEGTAADGKWEGSWTVTDTHHQTYKLILHALDSTGTTNVIDITLR